MSAPASVRLHSVNGSPVVEYRAVDGADLVAIQRRTLTPAGKRWMGDASDWRTLTVAEAAAQIRLDGPVAHWLREHISMDGLMHQMIADPDGPAYLAMRPGP